MTERFKKAYDSLVRAFFEGTLAKGSCMACACGNIIFDAVGDPISKEMFQTEVVYFGLPSQGLRIESLRKKISKANTLWADKRSFGGDTSIKALPAFENEVNEAGYTALEFAEIEKAFETNTKIKISCYYKTLEQEILEDQYNGLCAVVDVLMQLDSVKEGGEELKGKFRTHPKLMSCQ